MKKISPPSLQNAVRLWDATPERVCKNCIRLYDSRISFSYQPVNKLLLHKARFGDSTVMLIRCVMEKEKREWVLEYYEKILTLYGEHIDALNPKFAVEVQGYPLKISRELSIPVLPSMLLGLDGGSILPIPILWSKNNLNEEQLRMLVTAVRAQMRRNPDIEDSRLQLWDFSKPSGEEDRRLRITDGDSISVFTDTEFNQRLEVLAKGISLAQLEIDRRVEQEISRERERPNVDHGNQVSLFGDDLS